MGPISQFTIHDLPRLRISHPDSEEFDNFFLEDPVPPLSALLVPLKIPRSTLQEEIKMVRIQRQNVSGSATVSQKMLRGMAEGHTRIISYRILFILLSTTGCSGPQSALDPAGDGAERIATLFWWMFAGAAIIWVLVIGLTIYAIRKRHPLANQRRAQFLIIVGGTLLPVVVLTVLLVYGLAMLPKLTAAAPPGSLRIDVHGEQWWWRVRYQSSDGQMVELANEIRLPVGEVVELHLQSDNVIHSFWIPPLGGKLDMVPGHNNRLVLLPTRTGVFRGVCAEYCGASHALMQFPVVVMKREEFDGWLRQQREPALQSDEPEAARGYQLFFANGCHSCHSVRGTAANGVIGPDLTHVGTRLSLAAGTLPSETSDFSKWIANSETVKPEAHMPAFGMLPHEDLHALAIYLKSLK